MFSHTLSFLDINGLVDINGENRPGFEMRIKMHGFLSSLTRNSDSFVFATNEAKLA